MVGSTHQASSRNPFSSVCLLEINSRSSSEEPSELVEESSWKPQVVCREAMPGKMRVRESRQDMPDVPQLAGSSNLWKSME